MEQFSLYPLLQSAYRKSNITEKALFNVHNDILSNMDQKRVTLLFLLDLSTAFDTVDLNCSWDLWRIVSGYLALLWNGSVPTLKADPNVCSLDTQIASTCMRCGVPQGFCLGPQLLTIYASKLFQVIKSHPREVKLMQKIHSYICHLTLTHILVKWMIFMLFRIVLRTLEPWWK